MEKKKKEKGMGMIYKADQWSDAIELLYSVLRSTELEETTKWGGPCFTINGKNVVGLGGFKSYVGLWFHQGVFLKDPKNVLINASAGKTKALRQWRFSSIEEIDTRLVRAYVLEAIANARSGKEIKPQKQRTGKIPVELDEALKKSKKLKANFNSLSPYRQREYIEFISDARLEKTRLSRVEKSIILISEGKGLNDKYRR